MDDEIDRLRERYAKLAAELRHEKKVSEKWRDAAMLWEEKARGFKKRLGEVSGAVN